MRYILMLKLCCIIFLINGISGNYLTFGQRTQASLPQADTLPITLQAADSLLVTRNLSLVAARYQIEASRAQILQARVFHNPNINLAAGVFNPDAGGFFDIGSSGEKAIAVSQLFQIAGQRYTQVKIAREAVTLSELEFEDLGRSLKLKLHQSFFTLWYLEQLLASVNRQLSILGNTIDAYEGQFAKGNVALKDLIRLKSQFHQLNDSKTGIVSQMDEAYSTMKILLQRNLPFKTAPTAEELKNYDLVSPNAEELVSRALEQRPDLKIAETQLKQQQLQVTLQKKQWVPDLDIQYSWDQNASYKPNGSLLAVGFSVPLFDRNRGNIKTGKALAGSLESSLEEKRTAIREEVETAWRKYKILDEQYRKMDNDFRSQFDQLNDGLMTNYLKKNISLLEFTDLFDAYNQSVSLLYNLRINRINTWEELNYIVGN